MVAHEGMIIVLLSVAAILLAAAFLAPTLLASFIARLKVSKAAATSTEDGERCGGKHEIDELQVQNSSTVVKECEDDLALDDVVMEILSRLPVRTLLRFKSVCRNWNAIIPRSPHFASMHLKNYTNNPATKQPSLLCRYFIYLPGTDCHWGMRRTVSFTPDLQPISLDEELVERVICSAGEVGVLLLGDPDKLLHDYYLWNPATGQIKHLPDPYLDQSVVTTHYDRFIDEHGVGHDLVSNDIKVVFIRHDLSYWYIANGSISHVETQVLVYTLRSNSWRELEAGYPFLLDNGFPDISFTCHTYFKGSFYWLSNNANTANVVAFDMGTEVFRRINCDIFPPIHGISKHSWLVIYRDSIALFRRRDIFIQSQLNISVDVWLLSSRDGDDEMHCALV